MLMRKELLRFCESTSVKGIPRAVKAEHRGLQVTWIAAVVLMISLATYQVSLLVFEYLDYPSYSITNEKVFNPTDELPELPTLTVCNEQPFSSLKPQITGIPTLAQYYDMVEDLTQCQACDPITAGKMAVFRKLMKTTTAYFQQLGTQGSQYVGHDKHNLIVDCKEMLFLGMTFVERDCTSELINITLSADTEYFNCYRITLPNHYSMDKWGMISGVSLILYLDNIYNVSASKNNGTRKFIGEFGAVVIPTHEKGSAFPALDGIQLPAGISAKIQLTMEKQFRLEPPWGECQPSTVEGYEGMKMCISDCFQDHIRRNCHCTDVRMVQHMETEQYPFCLRLQHNTSHIVSNFECATNYLKTETATICLNQCPLPCKEFGYTTETSFSKWPNPGSMEAFYDAYIQGRDYEEYFAIAKEYIKRNCSSDLDCMVKYITAQKTIEDNFLQVKFHISDLRYMNTEEKKKIGIADFCSKLGGILNLWAGITVVLLLELVEVMARIIYFKIKPTTHVNTLDNTLFKHTHK